MKYKVEVVKNKKVLFNMIMQASAPGQTVRRTTNIIKRESGIDNYLILVINEKGEGWIYLVENNNAKVIDKFIINNTNELYYIFTGNKNISEVI